MLKKNNIKSKKGFTIIEVVLVLAIAGLIFLMVFIALPALQRGQRDTQRRNDMSRFLSQLAQYQANNNSNVPGSKDAFNNFIANYLRVNGDTFADPSGTNYVVNNYTTCTNAANGCQQKSTAATDYQSGYINVYTNATCSGETPQYEKGTRKIAITYKLEGAGIYCGHN